MAEAELLHRLYTNAAAAGEWEKGGARAIPLGERDASSRVSKEVLAGVDDLLRKTQPAGKERGWVVRRFAAPEGDAWACVVASYPDLVRDAGGRSGFLNHARLVRVSEPSFDAAALVEAAQSFPIEDICASPEEERLETYVDLITGEQRLTVRPVAVATLQELAPAFLKDVLIACLAGFGQKQRMRFALSTATVEEIATAWAAIPLALQRTSSWAIGVDDGCPVDVVFAEDGKPPTRIDSAALRECVQKYVDLLHAAPDELSDILRNPKIASVVALDEAVRRAHVAAPLYSGNAAPRSSGKGTMQPKKNRSRNDEWDPLDDATVAEMKRQYEAMHQSLKDYLDQKLAQIEKRQPSRGGAPSFATLAERWWMPVAGLLGLALIAFGAYWFLLRDRSDSRPVAATTQRSAPAAEAPAPLYTETQPEGRRAEPSPAERYITAAAANGNWAEAFRDFLAAEPVAAARAIASAGSPALDRFEERVAKGEDLQSTGREHLRTLLVEAIAARHGENVEVDGNAADVDMTALKQRYGVTATAGMDAESEIILRWMARPGR